jgi:hypothetical protein
VQGAISTCIPLGSEPSSSASAANPAHAKVRSRLLSSKILASEINSALEGLKVIIAPPTTKVIGKEPQSEASDEEPHPSSDILRRTTRSAAGNDDVDQNETFNQETDDGWESGTVDAGEDDSEAWDSGTVEGGGGTSNASEDESTNTEEGAIGEHLASEEKRTKVTAVRPATKKTKPSESTFLPSLSVGFARGDSDSDFSDSEAKAADGVRKNRRGQRARRACVYL